MLTELVSELKAMGVRTSIFIDPIEERLHAAAAIGCDRIELYTESYAKAYPQNPAAAVEPYKQAAKVATELGLGINAGHDLDMHNLAYLKSEIPNMAEVSIGHAIVCDALYLGLENTIQIYLRQLAQNGS